MDKYHMLLVVVVCILSSEATKQNDLMSSLNGAVQNMMGV